MPPLRTLPPAKAIKTERTHEENQERAYIAASRRSDRSLEARIESARRASEIHKRRTGRSLRVTEQDVVNEEMYEEEDDDLPAQYRRLTAHLQTGSADFNRRLSAYLTNHVAMRSALETAVQSSYAQQAQFAGGMNANPNASANGQWPMQSMYQSPMTGQNPLWGQMGNMQTSNNPNAMYQPSPYMQQQLQQQHGFRPTVDPAASKAAPQEHKNSTTGVNEAKSPVASSAGQRNMAVPADSKGNSTSTLSPPPTPALKTEQQSPSLSSASTPNFSPLTQFPSAYMPQWSSISAATDSFNPNHNQNSYYPNFLSSALPAESQMMLGPALDPADPLTAMFMAGAGSQPYDNYIKGQHATAPFSSLEKPHIGPSFQGLHSTLGGGIDPSQLDLHLSTQRPTKGIDAASQHEDAEDSTMSGSASTTEAPGMSSEAWDHFIEEGIWDVTSSQG